MPKRITSSSTTEDTTTGSFCPDSNPYAYWHWFQYCCDKEIGTAHDSCPGVYKACSDPPCMSKCPADAPYAYNPRASRSYECCSVPIDTNGNTNASICPGIMKACPGLNCADRPVDCAGSYGEWGMCDASGSRTRTYTITQEAIGGGVVCDTTDGAIEEDDACSVNCAGSYGEWSDCDAGTGERTKTFEVTRVAKNGGAA